MYKGSDPGDLNPYIDNPGCYGGLDNDPSQTTPLESRLFMNDDMAHGALLSLRRGRSPGKISDCGHDGRLLLDGQLPLQVVDLLCYTQSLDGVERHSFLLSR